MSSEIAIKVEKLSKCYQIYNQPHDRLKQSVYPRLQGLAGRPRGQYFREFWALKDISFEIMKGETVGIVGRNGSGKSTLLQMICGTVNPSGGEIQTNGRIAALLELGSGFNPEFTGRENVYMNAAILGLSKEEVDEKFDDIAAFADIRHFMDHAVKTYSSGMLARLAFSVAIQVDPDILIVDEALSVGDMAFQEKSFTRMKKIRDQGTAILFVSHSTSAVRNFCDRAIWLDTGNMRGMGERLSICDEYQKMMEHEIRLESSQTANNRSNSVSGQGGAAPEERKISIASVVSDKLSYRMGDDVRIEIGLSFSGQTPQFGVGIILYDLKGNVVTILNTLRDDIVFNEKKEKVALLIRDNHLAPGEYTVSISVSDEQGMFSYDKLDACLQIKIEMERSANGFAKVDGIVRCEHEWS
ncbi:ABC transporter ATP-binding protein [Collimonas sp.]|jgi:ABC-type polysaccharide/polyol phosphate transport system ATPase subunit|uniref:ABC transporter ATP-binding protein n=1 Tax=Collimonas sp. TaxID=1963772 RepID=UPI002C7264E0|nr:ABC transporter ATP-binding protein [Collimonas sp.]HWX02714.1 ABC transporter ATP-binding protein [Collimonas sp.]